MGELDADAKALADRMFEPRGYIHEWHLYLAQQRPEVLDLWERRTRTTNRTSSLPDRYRGARLRRLEGATALVELPDDSFGFWCHARPPSFCLV